MKGCGLGSFLKKVAGGEKRQQAVRLPHTVGVSLL